ncbi:MAG: hypothetical protein BA863_07800 [Desulfovibrio sp. S3730MH75]|nr:MAG: hypothetical protein BA863_07800 [Desulfovibrio sp. S3730MH75]
MAEEKISIEQLQASISGKGYDWEAGVTSVSELSEEEQNFLLGLPVTEEELEGMKEAIEASVETFSYPTSVDWRNHAGKDWTTPIRDQSSCASGMDFSVLAAMESRAKIQKNNPNLSIDLSEAYLLFCGCGKCCSTGWYFDPALNFIKNTGVADEKCYPYRPVDQDCKPCPDWKNRVWKIQDWSSIVNVSQRKQNLAASGPLIGGMAVYQDFLYYKGGVYRHTSGKLSGYSPKTIVGYDDNQKCWICKNSWGTGWGENGWFKIAYGQCDIDTRFNMYAIGKIIPAIEKGCGYATYALIDYYFAGTSRILWAYAGNRWRYRRIAKHEVAGIVKLLNESKRLYVCWNGNQITFVRGWKN